MPGGTPTTLSQLRADTSRAVRCGEADANRRAGRDGEGRGGEGTVLGDHLDRVVVVLERVEKPPRERFLDLVRHRLGEKEQL